MDRSCKTNRRPASFREFIKSSFLWKPLLSILVGGIAGYLYYHFIGCTSGHCAITGNPYLSAIGGGFLGYLLINSPCRSC